MEIRAAEISAILKKQIAEFLSKTNEIFTRYSIYNLINLFKKIVLQ